MHDVFLYNPISTEKHTEGSMQSCQLELLGDVESDLSKVGMGESKRRGKLSRKKKRKGCKKKKNFTIYNDVTFMHFCKI